MGPAVRWTIVLLGAIAVLWFSLRRDWRFSREYMGDLRNRVVGARIIEDGGSPYFYHWRQGDPIRYYDPQAFDHNRPSITTSTPFLHRLLIPIASFPESTIMQVWALLLWVLFAAMVAAAARLAPRESGRWAVFLTAILFLLTNAWELHFKYGQTYLVIAALAMLFYSLINRGGGQWRLAAAGLVAAGLVLVRLNAVFFFLPFLPLKRWRRWAFILPIGLMAGWVLLSPHERRLWMDYREMVREQVQVHQGLDPVVQANDPDPHIRQWEGLNTDTIAARIGRDPVRIYTENGNVFVILQKSFGVRLPVWLLELAGLAAIAAGLVAWWPRAGTRDIRQVAIVGFCLYMISDLFSPVYRHQYNTVQWIMPLLLAASMWNGRQRLAYLTLLLALLLNIIHLPFIKMPNTLGEYGFLAGLLAIGFAQRVENLPGRI